MGFILTSFLPLNFSENKIRFVFFPVGLASFLDLMVIFIKFLKNQSNLEATMGGVKVNRKKN
ncbi:TPA: hypothetical protein DEW47_01155 [Patescibacteria group bacterium]|nr:hypothetical protein [Patescibacteria group bacterium]